MDNFAHLVNEAVDEITKAYDDKKAAMASIKDIKKNLKLAISENSDYQDLLKRKNTIRVNMDAFKDELDEIKAYMEEIEMGYDEYAKIDEYESNQDYLFNSKKSKVVSDINKKSEIEVLDAGCNKNGAALTFNNVKK